MQELLLYRTLTDLNSSIVLPTVLFMVHVDGYTLFVFKRLLLSTARRFCIKLLNKFLAKIA